MNIEIMTNMQSWINKNPRYAIGENESWIQKLESTYKVKLPKAYKEFIVLGGEEFYPMNGISFHIEHCSRIMWPNEKAWLKEEDVEIKRPYWAFGYDDYSLFFFYLDEGDNPPVWIAEYENKDEIEDWMGKASDSFSAFIDWCISRFNPAYHLGR